LGKDMVPKKIFFTKGVGKHKERLTSFELALRDAGIAAQNLVRVSSIFPPNCKLIPRSQGLTYLHPGEVVFAVVAENSTHEPHRLLASSIGVAIPADRNTYGYLSEHHSFGETEDSAGDYAEATFAKMDARKPGSKAALDAKALRLFANRDVVIPAAANPGAYLLLTANRGDAFLSWCTAAAVSVKTNPAQLRSLELPPDIVVNANYGLTLRNGAPVEAGILRGFIVSPAGQAILKRYGFTGA